VPDREQPEEIVTQFDSAAICRLMDEFSCDWDYWIAPDGTIRYMSPSCERLTGYTEEEFLADPSLLERLIHPEDRAWVIKHVHRERLSPQSHEQSFDFRIVHRSGEVRWLNHLCRPVYGTNGEFLGARAANRDVTEAKLREEALKENWERYRAVIDDQIEPVCRFLPDGTITFVNAAFRNSLGRTDEQLIGKNLFRRMPEPERRQLLERLGSLKPDDPCFTYEQQANVSVGNLGWRQWKVRGTFNPDGSIVEIQAVGHDITDRKQTEKALRKSEARYSNLIRAIPDAVVAYDPQGRVTYVNDGFVQLYGWSREELVGRSIDFVPFDERERTLAAWQKTFGGEKVFFETRRRTRTGEVLEIQLRTAILRDPEGNIRQSVVIHRDVTERKRAQEALQRAHDELERRVEERTAELAQINEQLRREIIEREHAQEKLQESESRQRMLVENAPLGIIWCDIHGNILQVNPNLLAIVGSRSLDKTMSVNLLSDETLIEVGISQEVRRCIDSGGPRVFECPFTTKWRKFAWLRVHMAPTRDSLGRITGVQAIVEDITYRKQAETALSESEERFRAVFETAQDCIFLKDRALVYSHVNPAFLKALDLRESQVIGKTDDEIFSIQEAGYIKNLEGRVLSGQVIEATYNMTAHELPRTVHCVRVPMRNASGDTIGICGIARDVTERRALERGCPRPSGRYRSAVMENTLEQVRLAAHSESIVLLLGESGSGKDYLAKYLHDQSRRAGGPFFAINCAALATSIAESELFGHEPGSFTGSRGRKRGLLEMAEGGTLLLNEIGELSHELQAKLLTFLDTQSFTRVGGDKTILVSARIVAATNRDLEREVAVGRFREDLYYRLNVFAIHVPSLRERREDIPFLAGDILETLALKLGMTVPPVLDVSALEAFLPYEWPGNVRELRNVLERALILSRGRTIRGDDINLPRRRADRGTDDYSVQEIPVAVSVSKNCTMNDALESAKRLMIVAALRRSAGNVSAAARSLGISRDALRYHMKTLEITRWDTPSPAAAPGGIPLTLPH